MEHIERDIIIIGAGVAGLLAGRMLARAGQSVAVLEARPRVGGRILTSRVPVEGIAESVVVELGAEFIHGLPQESWTLLHEAKLPVYELFGSHLRSVNSRLMCVDDDTEGGGNVMQAMIDWADQKLRGGDASFAEFLQSAGIGERSAQRAVHYVEGFNAAESPLISVAALVRQQRAEDAIESDRLFRVRSGYDGLPEYLAAGLQEAGGQLSLEHVVQRVEWRRGLVCVQGERPGGQEFILRARRVVITLPLGVLQAGSIAIAPLPGEALMHAGRMVMGQVLRVTLVFQTAFWRDSNPERADLSFVFADNELPGVWWTAAPNPAPTLTGWVGGARNVEAIQARIASRGGRDALAGLYLEALARIFGLEAGVLQSLLVGCYLHDWQHDEFSRGAYSYMPRGAIDASDRLAEPIEETLYFAGEHTDTTGHWGTVHGALRSGLRAAEQIRARSM